MHQLVNYCTRLVMYCFKFNEILFWFTEDESVSDEAFSESEAIKILSV